MRSELTDPRPRWSCPDFGAKARAPHIGPVSSQPHPFMPVLLVAMADLGVEDEGERLKAAHV